MVAPTSFVTLVKEAFPHWECLTGTCAIRLGIDGNQPDFGDVIDAITRGCGRAALIRRLQDTHPPRRPHHEQFDARFWNAFVEAEAFAWAQDVAGLGQPQFIDGQGAPDLRVGEVWIEAKTIEESRDEREATEGLERQGGNGIIFRGPVTLTPPDGALLAKFQSQFEDAQRKLARQSSGRLITFFDLRDIDFGVNRDQTLRAVTTWAETRAADSKSGIVVCFNHAWSTPFVTAGL